MPEDRRARLTRLVAGEIRRLAPEGSVGVAVDRQTGGNAGWTITITLGQVRASARLVGSDEDPYALTDAQFIVAARHLLADARRKAARGQARSGSGEA
ncbi:MAG TPA: hypothetical protein VEV45_05175 [Streptosporangiaceae bacterium]|nr:hypothetical protein [Streptosporangiaceae bacterium]